MKAWAFCDGVHYGLDFCPAFWDWLDEGNRRGRVFSIDAVYTELMGHEDELSEWARERKQTFFLKPDPVMTEAFTTVSGWLEEHYSPEATSVFLSGADYLLVCHALAHDHVVVTHERPSSSRTKVKIPTVCTGLGVSWMSPFAMLRRERARFVLA